jgi:ArsR family transcriptional regulator
MPAALKKRKTTDSAEIASPSCACALVHTERVEAAKKAAPDPLLLADLGELFQVFADPTRLGILSALAAGELCVCDLGAVLGMSQSAVSHQLAVLRGARLVRYRREGKVVHYRLDDEHVGAILAVGFEHVGERGRS